MKYEVLLFDADETLFDFKKTERYAFLNALIDFGLENNKERFIERYKIINKKIWEEFEKGLITSDKLRVERFVRLFSEFGVNYDPKAFANSYIYHMGNSSYTFPEAESVIEDLSCKYKLAIVTNGLKEVQINRLKKSNIGKYFDGVIISEEVNSAKPDKEIFTQALNKMSVRNKDKVLMIGDSLTADIKGGINSGIDTCWYNPHRAKNILGIEPTYEIYTLLALRDILL
ncbi:YjjG family noncanonical pyrimidine nucleotidase [Clostridium paraputrificum]|uniref:YjjG family noncanonical pyrimidine nucleotidase n=1 Tax=Clostridium paraputrificum TaxID=29363 RepID=UPI003D3563BD